MTRIDLGAHGRRVLGFGLASIIEETPRYGLIAAGVSMTATLWVVSTITAISLDREASQDGALSGSF